MRIKICGIQNGDQALLAIDHGADILGFIFYPRSSRYVSMDQVKVINQRLPQPILKVGVFVDESVREVLKIVETCELDMIQLHGDEDPRDYRSVGKPIIKAVTKPLSVDLADFYLLDSSLGERKITEGSTPSSSPSPLHSPEHLQIASGFDRDRLFISGGLNSQNVALAISTFQPYGVDVCRGVEGPDGNKCPILVRNFVKSVQLGLNQSPQEQSHEKK